MYEIPIVDVIKACLIKSPLIEILDFSFSSVSITALKFFNNLSSSNDFFPILKPIFPSLSFLISTCPDLALLTASLTFQILNQVSDWALIL